MIIFVYGDDGVRVMEKVKQLRSHYLAKIDQSGTNLAEFPVAGSSSLPFADVLQAVQSSPFLADKRMVIIRGLCETKKAEAKQWVEGLCRAPDSSIVVIVDVLEAKNVEKHEVYTGLKTKAEVHHYPQEKLEGTKLAAWIVERAKQRGSAMTLADAQELVARIGDDLWCVQNEIDKLAAYAGQRSITKEMIDLLTSKESEGNIFAFVDAVCKKDTKTALRLLEQERLAGSADLYILAMLARHVRLLLQIRTAVDEGGGQEKQLGIHAFVLQKTLPQAKNTVSSTLFAWHDVLQRLDRDAKRGLIDPTIAVDRFVVELLTN